MQKKFVELASGVVKHTLVALVLIFIIMVVAVFKGAFASIKFCLFLGGVYMASLIFAVKLTQVCLASMAVFLCRTTTLQNGKRRNRYNLISNNNKKRDDGIAHALFLFRE